jgi:hypothetical protein
MEPDGSSQRLQGNNTGPHPVSQEFNPHPETGQAVTV